MLRCLYDQSLSLQNANRGLFVVRTSDGEELEADTGTCTTYIVCMGSVTVSWYGIQC
jgi:hypothetical protein